MTTNYKTSFLIPHDYEIPTFNYRQYVLPPVPYNYKVYTKDIWDAKTRQPLKTKITAPAQCTNTLSIIRGNNFYNLFNDEFNQGYFEVEIDLKEIDPTIQSIDKFISSYKIIEISNLGNLQIECAVPNTENFIPNRNVNILGGVDDCKNNFKTLNDISLRSLGLSQSDKINFDNTITLYTDNINNNIQTFATAYTNDLTKDLYESTYEAYGATLLFLLQITSLSNKVNDKIKETYLQLYYTNDIKLKIRFSKVLYLELSLAYLNHSTMKFYKYFGNDKKITIDIDNSNVLGIRNNSINPVKITIKPR